MALISTIGGADSNSYVNLAYADDYFTLSPYSAQWTAFDDAAKNIALVQACAALEAIDYAGTRCNPSTDDANAPQALAWPRSGASCDGVQASCAAIPKAIKDAQCLLALNLATNPDSINGPIGGGGGVAAGTYVSSKKLGDLQIDYAAFPSGESSKNDCVDCSTPGVIATYPWLKGMLSCWADISTSTSKVLLRVRS